VKKSGEGNWMEPYGLKNLLQWLCIGILFQIVTGTDPVFIGSVSCEPRFRRKSTFCLHIGISAIIFVTIFVGVF